MAKPEPKMPDEPDLLEQKLTEAIQKLREDATDEDSWTLLIQSLWPRIVALAARSLGSRFPLVDAEDIAQETFLDLAQRWNSTSLDRPDDVRRYLAQSTRHRVVSWARRWYSARRDIRRERSISTEVMADEEDHLSHHDWGFLPIQEELEQFEALFAYDELDGKILGRLAKGLTQADTAKELNVSESRVSRRVKRLKGLWSAWKSRDTATENER
jgi:RNA polymerase sigma factor (sigma-70 family)